jgi:hypothetical protein
MSGETPGPRQIWQDLEEGDTSILQGDFRYGPADVWVDERPVLLGLDQDNLRHILVPLRAQRELNAAEVGGIAFCVVKDLRPNVTLFFLDVKCTRRDGNSVFAYFAEDFLLALKGNPNDVVRLFMESLVRWKNLFDTYRPPLLRSPALCGLFAELWHLKKIVLCNPLAFRTWVGFKKGKQDFIGRNTALEVKSTEQAGNWSFRIHGLEQLQPIDGISLFLSAVQVSRLSFASDDAEYCSVPELIDSIALTGVAFDDLFRALKQVGYDPRDEQAYRTTWFKVQAQRFFLVSPEFPKLTQRELVSGVEAHAIRNVHYTIDLADYPAEEETALERACRRLAASVDATM